MWDTITAWFVSIYESVVLGISDMFASIPAPDFLSNMESIVLPASVGFFAAPFQFPFGLSIVVSAYTIRFLIRRLPFVG